MSYRPLCRAQRGDRLGEGALVRRGGKLCREVVEHGVVADPAPRVEREAGGHAVRVELRRAVAQADELLQAGHAGLRADAVHELRCEDVAVRVGNAVLAVRAPCGAPCEVAAELLVGEVAVRHAVAVPDAKRRRGGIVLVAGGKARLRHKQAHAGEPGAVGLRLGLEPAQLAQGLGQVAAGARGRLAGTLPRVGRRDVRVRPRPAVVRPAGGGAVRVERRVELVQPAALAEGVVVRGARPGRKLRTRRAAKGGALFSPGGAGQWGGAHTCGAGVRGG